MINNKTLMCIVDYYSKFPSLEKVAGLLADDIVHTTKLIFAEFGLPKTIISDAVMNFTSKNIQVILQNDKHPTVYNILLSPPEQ